MAGDKEGNKKSKKYVILVDFLTKISYNNTEDWKNHNAKYLGVEA